MLTENFWTKSNILERTFDNDLDINLTIDFNKTKVDELTNDLLLNFDLSTKEVCSKLKNIDTKLYLSLSGGYDSDFVFHKFVEYQVPFTPIIVKTEANVYESSYAFRSCKVHDITPIVLERNTRDLMEFWFHSLWKSLKGVGYNSVPSVWAGEYAKENGGVLVIGEHLLLDWKEQDGIDLGYSEWDFYNDYFIGEKETIPFFMYDANICYHLHRLALEEKYKYLSEADFKCDIYRLPFRPKIRYNWGDSFKELFRKVIVKEAKMPKTQMVLDNSILEKLKAN